MDNHSPGAFGLFRAKNALANGKSTDCFRERYLDQMKARKTLCETCNRMIAKELSFIEGSRLIAALGHHAGLSSEDRELQVFLTIESETDDIPTGNVGQHWNKQAIKKNLERWSKAEAWAQEIGASSARLLAQRLRGG